MTLKSVLPQLNHLFHPRREERMEEPICVHPVDIIHLMEQFGSRPGVGYYPPIQNPVPADSAVSRPEPCFR
jgi:hypothetical protein